MSEIYEFRETEKHGVFLKVSDLDLADEFDDYITEKVYVLYNASFSDLSVEFCFGKAASISKVKDLVERFKQR